MKTKQNKIKYIVATCNNTKSAKLGILVFEANGYFNNKNEALKGLAVDILNKFIIGHYNYNDEYPDEEVKECCKKAAKNNENTFCNRCGNYLSFDNANWYEENLKLFEDFINGLSNKEYHSYNEECHQYWFVYIDYKKALCAIDKTNTIFISNLGKVLAKLVEKEKLYDMINKE